MIEIILTAIVERGIEFVWERVQKRRAPLPPGEAGCQEPVACFQNRVEQSAAIRQFATAAGPVRWYHLHGPTGVGRTELVRHALHQLQSPTFRTTECNLETAQGRRGSEVINSLLSLAPAGQVGELTEQLRKQRIPMEKRLGLLFKTIGDAHESTKGHDTLTLVLCIHGLEALADDEGTFDADIDGLFRYVMRRSDDRLMVRLITSGWDALPSRYLADPATIGRAVQDAVEPLPVEECVKLVDSCAIGMPAPHLDAIRVYLNEEPAWSPVTVINLLDRFRADRPKAEVPRDLAEGHFIAALWNDPETDRVLREVLTVLTLSRTALQPEELAGILGRRKLFIDPRELNHLPVRYPSIRRTSAGLALNERGASEIVRIWIDNPSTHNKSLDRWRSAIVRTCVDLTADAEQTSVRLRQLEFTQRLGLGHSLEAYRLLEQLAPELTRLGEGRALWALRKELWEVALAPAVAAWNEIALAELHYQVLDEWEQALAMAEEVSDAFTQHRHDNALAYAVAEQLRANLRYEQGDTAGAMELARGVIKFLGNFDHQKSRHADLRAQIDAATRLEVMQAKLRRTVSQEIVASLREFTDPPIQLYKANAHNSLGFFHEAIRDDATALAEFTTARDLYREELKRVASDDPLRESLEVELGTVLVNRSRISLIAGDRQSALTECREGFAKSEPNPQCHSYAALALAILELVEQHHAEAQPLLQIAKDWGEQEEWIALNAAMVEAISRGVMQDFDTSLALLEELTPRIDLAGLDQWLPVDVRVNRACMLITRPPQGEWPANKRDRETGLKILQSVVATCADESSEVFYPLAAWMAAHLLEREGLSTPATMLLAERFKALSFAATFDTLPVPFLPPCIGMIRSRPLLAQ